MSGPSFVVYRSDEDHIMLSNSTRERLHCNQA